MSQSGSDDGGSHVMSALYPFQPQLPIFSILQSSKPVGALRTALRQQSLLYRCVRVSGHVCGTATLAMIVSRCTQCCSEEDLLNHEAMDLFEKRYHHKVLDGFSCFSAHERQQLAAAV